MFTLTRGHEHTAIHVECLKYGKMQVMYKLSHKIQEDTHAISTQTIALVTFTKIAQLCTEKPVHSEHRHIYSFFAAVRSALGRRPCDFLRAIRGLPTTVS